MWRWITSLEFNYYLVKKIFILKMCKRKDNFSSRKGYSIEIALLEKKILWNYLMREKSETVYTMTDLEVYYNR